MRTLNRKEFLKRLFAVACAAALPRISFGDTRARPNALGIVDLHCHPSLKMYLWGKQIWRKYRPEAGPNYWAMQITVDELKRGWVKGMLCAHYLPEGAITTQAKRVKRNWWLIRFLYPITPYLGRPFHRASNQVEYQNASNITQIYRMMKELEDQLDGANRKQNDVRFVLARNYQQFAAAIDEGAIPVAHAIEGAHALGRNFPLTSLQCDRLPPEIPEIGSMHGHVENYLRNLDALKQKGVCLITLSHFFENDLSFPVEGISADEKKNIELDWSFDLDQKCDRPLTDIGATVVGRMLDIGMVVDLTHSTPAVRRQVFQINRDREKSGKPVRPLTFTHTGSRRVFDEYTAQCPGGPYTSYRYYDVCDEEIEQICQCNGVIGVIPENFWLVGCDPALAPGDRFKDGIAFMVETIQKINEKTVTQQYDNIGIGTDFDGLADAPRDLYKPSQLDALIERLRACGVTDEQIGKITSGNARRMLKEGWVS